jgi:hypothetical protein
LFGAKGGRPPYHAVLSLQSADAADAKAIALG